MNFQIKEVVLWPKKSGIKPRRLPFKIGSVNVISGASRTGKSAIIPIIDYCLGSDKCSIPVLTIRNACEWFGVVVQTSAGEKLFARREPGSQKSTGDMFIVEAPTVDIPDHITQTNSNVRAVKRTLDELAGLTNLDFDPNDSEASFLSRPSFRDLGPFLFQPQNVVANPDILFYKADRPEHSQKLQTIFPYVLNAVTPQLLAKQHELEKLKRELRRKKGELATASQISERWMSEVKAKVTEARELGLIEPPVHQNATQGQLVDMLSQVVARPAGSDHKITSATVEEAVKEFVSLQTEESKVSMRLSGLRRRLGEMETLRQTSKEFEGALHLQRDRLKISDWLATMHNDGSDCPVCGHASTLAKERLATLCTALRAVEESAGLVGNVPAAFDRELERVKTEIRETTEQLDGIKIRRQAIEKRSSQAKQTYYDSLRVSRFIGNLEQSLQLYSQIGHDSNLENEVKSLEEQVAALEKDISEGAIRAKTQRALASVNLNAGKLIPGLDAERPNDPISLSIPDLSIKVKGIDREDFLWEIGSGSNWLSYHVAVSLGLHQFFLALPFSPVPNFVVYDQPSQVYFPVRLAGKATPLRRKLETHPKTGAAQLVEIRETVKEVIVPVYVQTELAAEPKPASKKKFIFAEMSNDELLGYGVPAEWLSDVQKATEDTLLALTDHLPAEAAEALLELATGGKPHAAKSIVVAANPFDHPDAQRRFRVMTNVEELQRALEFPWEKWTVFLHPEQRQWVEHDYSGPARVSGSAGTGKTIVALHRAVFLARANPEARVLLTTFSEALANALRTKLRRLISNESRLAERLEVHSIGGIGQRLYKAHLGQTKIVTQEKMVDLLKAASKEVEGHKFTLPFLLMEWEQVVDAWQLETWEAYRDVMRLGRKTRLPEKQRVVLWSIFDRVRAQLATENLITISGMFGKLAGVLAKTKNPPFNFAVVDESQDISVAHLRFLAALGAGRPNSLFFAGDLGQRIFQQPFSWKELGVDIRGRARTLHVNYRTSHQIRMQADRLLAPEVSDADGNTEERGHTISVFNGPPPIIAVYDNVEEETAAVGKWISERHSEGVMPHEFGVFVRSLAEIDRAVAAVKKGGLPFKILDDNVETASGHVSISTMHLAKGLEFRAVVVMACDDEVIPLQTRIESVTDDADLEEVYNTERHLLYVACTRARDFLLVTSVAPASEFLEDLKA